MNRIKVFFLAGWYPTRVNSNNGIFIKNCAESVSKYCDVTVLHIEPDYKLPAGKVELEKAAENSVGSYILYFNPGKPLKLSVYYYHQLFQIAVKEKGLPDLIHVQTNLPDAGFLAYLIKIFRGIPYLVTEHYCAYSELDGRYAKSSFIKKFLTKIVVKNAAVVTTPSEFLYKAMLSHHLKGNYTVIPNIVNTDLFSAEKKPLNSKKRILHVSNLGDDIKNIKGILNAVKIVSAIRSDFVLDLVGDNLENSNKQMLEEYAEKLGIINKFVIFYGYQEYTEVAKFMKKADFFILFSNFENSPCVIIEAFNTGLPVVASNIGGIPELINKDNGILVEVKNDEKLAEAIIYMLDHNQEYDRKKIRENAEMKYSYSAVGSSFYKIYEKTLEWEKAKTIK